MTKLEVANLVESFVNGTCGPWEWDDFVSMKHEDPGIEAISLHCGRIPEQFPSSQENHYCSEEGVAALKQIALLLRSEMMHVTE
jgi:hypothetical protein